MSAIYFILFLCAAAIVASIMSDISKNEYIAALNRTCKTRKECIDYLQAELSSTREKLRQEEIRSHLLDARIKRHEDHLARIRDYAEQFLVQLNDNNPVQLNWKPKDPEESHSNEEGSEMS